LGESFLLSLYITFPNALIYVYFFFSPFQHTARETKIISHVVQLLGEWAELFPYDFRDERMMAHVRTITQKCVAVDPPVRESF
jgi:hypothetical protein